MRWCLKRKTRWGAEQGWSYCVPRMCASLASQLARKTLMSVHTCGDCRSAEASVAEPCWAHSNIQHLPDLCCSLLLPLQAFYVGISRSHSDRLIYIHIGEARAGTSYGGAPLRTCALIFCTF